MVTTNRLGVNGSIVGTLFVLVPFALIVSLSLLSADAVIIKTIISIACVVAIFVVMYPKIYFILFLILRPSMHLIADQQIVMNINIASITTVFLILVGSLTLLGEDNLKKITGNRVLVKANKIFLCFLLISSVSMINTKDFLVSFTDLLRLVSIMVIFNYSFVHFCGKEKFKPLFLIILLSAFLPLYLGFTQYLFKTGNMETANFNRIYGTFVHPNTFAQYLSVFFLLVLCFLKMYKTNTALKVVLSAFLILSAFEIYHTYARGVWIALALSLIVFSLSYKGAGKLTFYFLVAVILFAISPNIQKRFEDIKHPGPHQMSSWEWRTIAWNKTKSEIRNHPIIGHGLGMYGKTFPFVAHNDYLRLAYETGILGLSVYLLYLFYLLNKSVKLALASRDDRMKSKYTVILSLIAALLIMSTADNLVRSTAILVYIFSIVGALLGPETENLRSGLETNSASRVPIVSYLK
jgi:O-antigen ligase